MSAQVVDSVPTLAESSGFSVSPTGILGALGSEAELYVDDAKALVTAPFHWGPEDRKTAVGVVVLIGGLMAFDERLAHESQERRSAFTNRVSSITTGLGSGDAWAVSGGLLASGIAFHDRRLASIGREAIEASILAGLIANILKPAFGRERPITANNETVFEPASSNYSFPSGHSTEAFAVASVIATRSSGWLVPTLAYACASVVAFDRVNDHAHFPSDVLAGAAIGIAVGRFVVHRHEPAAETDAPHPSITLAPIPRGLAVVARF